MPKPWFDQFPLESIRRPAEPDGVDDWADMPEFARRLARTHAHKPLHKGLSDHEYIVANDQWDATIRAYHASIAFVDRQIGRFLDSLKENPRGRETFVMLVSDHGWHLGEKKHWCKGAIWEQTTHIPFIVRGPGIETGSTCTQPVSLIDVYPSLVDLAGFENSRLARRNVHQAATRRAILSRVRLRFHLMGKATPRFAPSVGVTSVTKTAAKNSMTTESILTNGPISRTSPSTKRRRSGWPK